MKKLMMMMAAAMLATATVQAQDAGSAREHKSPEEKARMMTQRMDKQLDLTDEQEVKVQDIYLNFARRKAVLKQNAGEDKDAMRGHMQALKAETDRQLRAVLTPEQWQKKEQMQAERKEKHGKHKDHKGHHGKKGQNKQK